MASVRYVFDRWGVWLGFVDGDGHYFDNDGHHVANVASGGKVYRCDGSPNGRLDVQGQFWSEDGRSLGYLAPRVVNTSRFNTPA